MTLLARCTTASLITEGYYAWPSSNDLRTPKEIDDVKRKSTCGEPLNDD